MKKYIFSLIFIIGLLGMSTGPVVAAAQTPNVSDEDPAIHFFYSTTCPHCHAEHDFLDDIEDEYPTIDVERYDMSKRSNHGLLRSLAEKTGAEQYLGTVPLTFIGDEFIVGFDNPSGVGKDIRNVITREFDVATSSVATTTTGTSGQFSLLGLSFDPSAMSLPAAAAALGILDGFNVCSLGALVLILGLVMTLGSRRKIALYGGGFIITTALMYGGLIVLWHQLFSLLAPFVVVMEVLLALLGIGGGIYFLREYRRFRRDGVTCSSNESPFISGASRWVQGLFQRRTSILGLLVAIIGFAAVVTIVEFPCSAAVPVMFAGILAAADISPLAYLGYIAIFVLFYLLDELIIFGFAVYKLRLWLASDRFTIWAALIEGLLLLGIGGYYVLSIIVGIA